MQVEMVTWGRRGGKKILSLMWTLNHCQDLVYSEPLSRPGVHDVHEVLSLPYVRTYNISSYSILMPTGPRALLKHLSHEEKRINSFLQSCKDIFPKVLSTKYCILHSFLIARIQYKIIIYKLPHKLHKFSWSVHAMQHCETTV